METNKIISALCYISILFAPFLLPLIVYFVVQDTEVKYHAKRSFLSHLVPIGFIILIAIFGFIGIFSSIDGDMNGFIIILLGLMVVYFIVTIGLIIWNIIQAIRLLR